MEDDKSFFKENRAMRLQDMLDAVNDWQDVVLVNGEFEARTRM